MTDKRKWWWLAINGASCAASSFPVEKSRLCISPIPEIVIGYETQDEQIERQKFFLNAAIPDIERYLQGELMALVSIQQATAQRLPNPEPPTDGPTIWTDFKS